MGVEKRRGAILIGLCLTVMALAAVDLSLGSVRAPILSLFSALARSRDADPLLVNIVWLFRVPKAITALVAGAGLAVSGLLLQTLFSNPLAGPDVLGLNSGASIGVAALLLLGIGADPNGSSFLGFGSLFPSLSLAVSATLGALAVLLAILFVSQRTDHVATLLIIGLLIGYLASSVVSFLVYFALPQKVATYLSWSYGSFQSVSTQVLPVLSAASLLGVLLSFLLSRPLDALLLGPRYAQSLGVNLRSLRVACICLAALLSGAVTAFCGPVAFLGIAAPHAARGVLRTSSHRLLIPATALLGSAFALGADALCQLPPNGAVLPLNPVLTLIGAPIIIAVVAKGGKALRHD
jgi:iron complex transport system permease protein